MSAFVPSELAWARPLVTSGTAVMPPVPVLVPTPAPDRRNQVSTVNGAAPSAPAAAPNVTWSFVPSNASECGPDGGCVSGYPTTHDGPPATAPFPEPPAPSATRPPPPSPSPPPVP